MRARGGRCRACLPACLLLLLVVVMPAGQVLLSGLSDSWEEMWMATPPAASGWSEVLGREWAPKHLSLWSRLGFPATSDGFPVPSYSI